MKPKSNRMILMNTSVLLFIVLIGALVGNKFYHDGTKVWFVFLISATSIITFYGFVIVDLSSGQKDEISDRGMRLAITASVVATYLALVGSATFFGSQVGEMPQIASALLTNFTSIVGVIIAFYFGSSAYIEARTRGVSKKDGSNEA